jgi:hypothetical protein
MLRNLLVAVTVCILGFQCAGTVMKIMPGYRTMNVEKSKLGIILLSDNMTIANPNDITEYLDSGETKQVFYDFFISEILDGAEQDGNFEEVAIAGKNDTSGFTSIQERLSRDEQVDLRVPKQKSFLGDSLQYLLILDNIDVSRKKNPGKKVMMVDLYGMPMEKKTGEIDNLKIKGTFALWDNAQGKIAAFGRINEEFDALPVMTKNSWAGIVRKISKNIFINQPYGIQTAAPR